MTKSANPISKPDEISSILLSLAALLLLTATLLAPRIARAEPAAKRPSIAVIAFPVLPNAAKRVSADFGDRATKAMIAGMKRSRSYRAFSWDLLPIRLSAPDIFPQNDCLAGIGRRLGAADILTGVVASIGFVDNPRQARITLSIRITDVPTGELVNGAICTGYSLPATSRTSDAVLIDQALSDAVHNAVKIIDSYPTPTGTLTQIRKDQTVHIDRGERDGLIEGQEMIVTRAGRRIGSIRIIHVHASDADGIIVDPGQGVRKGDRVLAIFSLPDYGIDA